MPPTFVAGRRYPLVIQTHGFDPDEFLSDGPFTTAFAARPLASAGFIVLQMNSDASHITGPQEVPDNVRGFQSAITQLDALGLIDPKRVGIIGFSRTCYYVVNALVWKPTLFAAASVTDGTDASYMQYMLFEHDTPELENTYGSKPFGNGLHAWIKNAPDFHLNQIRAPLLITAIGRDSLLGQWELYMSLSLQKKPVDLIYIPNGQHVLQNPLDRLASQQTNVDWFLFWLQGYENPDAAKASQYKLWETLRRVNAH
jgi:dipeptidyl aminopeptidase/acylaminoacyl peptidase